MTRLQLDAVVIEPPAARGLRAWGLRSACEGWARTSGAPMPDWLWRFIDEVEGLALDTGARSIVVEPVETSTTGSAAKVQRMISSRAAAERLGVTPQQIGKLVRGGDLIGRNPTGRGWVIDASSVDELAALRGLPESEKANA